MFVTQKAEFSRLLELENQQNSNNIIVNETLAMVVGLNSAIIIQSLHDFLKDPIISFNGYDWITKSFDDWHKERLKFWSISTVRRAFQEAKSMNVVIIEKMKIHNKQCVCFTINYPLITLKIKNYLNEIQLLGQNDPHYNKSTPTDDLEGEPHPQDSQDDTVLNDEMANILTGKLTENFTPQQVTNFSNLHNISIVEAVTTLLKTLLNADQLALLNLNSESAHLKIINEWMNGHVGLNSTRDFVDLSNNDVDKFFATDNLNNFVSLKTVIEDFEAYKMQHDSIHSQKPVPKNTEDLGVDEIDDDFLKDWLTVEPMAKPKPKKTNSKSVEQSGEVTDESEMTDAQKRAVFIKQLLTCNVVKR